MPAPDLTELESLDDARTLVARLLSVTEATAARRAQLESALRSRIVIEQAKGILAERYRLDVAHAFTLLRRAARSNNRKLRDLATEVVASSTTPREIEQARRGRGV